MEKWTQEQYAARLQEMKQEAHDKMWLYIEVNAKEFMNKKVKKENSKKESFL